MNLTRDRMRSLGWFSLIAVCALLTLALTFKVNALKREVRITEHRLAQVRQDKLFLETEFETRANQQQLKALNDVEYGYQAPTAGQYLEGERQLAALGKPRSADAPSPIRVANAGQTGAAEASFPAMVSPLTGKAMAAEAPRGPRHAAASSATLRDRLSRVESARAVRE